VCLAALLVAVALFTMRGELSPLKRPMLWGASVGFSVVAAAAALLAAEVTAAPRSWLARALALRPLATLGFYSYGIYLVHPLMTDGAWWLAKRAVPEQNLAQFTLTFALAVAMALAGSWAMYQTVERPFRRLRAKMRAPGGTRHDEPAIAAEPAGPGAVAAG
jgi:peptidoglycan/LPS O-acetylase OafA/YrhL